MITKVGNLHSPAEMEKLLLQVIAGLKAEMASEGMVDTKTLVIATQTPDGQKMPEPFLALVRPSLIIPEIDDYPSRVKRALRKLGGIGLMLISPCYISGSRIQQLTDKPSRQMDLDRQEGVAIVVEHYKMESQTYVARVSYQCDTPVVGVFEKVESVSTIGSFVDLLLQDAEEYITSSTKGIA